MPYRIPRRQQSVGLRSEGRRRAPNGVGPMVRPIPVGEPDAEHARHSSAAGLRDRRRKEGQEVRNRARPTRARRPRIQARHRAAPSTRLTTSSGSRNRRD